MATVEEIGIWLILRLRQKRRQRRYRRWYLRPLNRARHENGEFFSLVLPMRDIDDEKHHQYFRMSTRTFDDLLHRITPLITHHKTHTEPVTPAERLAVTLRFLTTGISYQALSASYKLGSATVGRIVREVCKAIWTALKNDILAFPSEDKWKQIQKDFNSAWNFPNCVGALDGKHVRVRAPVNSGSSFYIYKGYFSFILMAVCDARYKFTVVDIGAYGSDAGVFSRSAFGSQLIQGKLPLPPPSALPGSDVLCPPVFIADEAFPLKVNLMRPYSGTNLTAEQRVYNYRHSRARRVVENAFGILAARWRVFGKAMECSVETAEDITKACMGLHNYLCGIDQLQADTARYISSTLVDEGDVQGEWRQVVEGDTNLFDPGRLTTDRATRLGIEVRNGLRSYFQTDAGRVAFQDAVLRRGTLC